MNTWILQYTVHTVCMLVNIKQGMSEFFSGTCCRKRCFLSPRWHFGARVPHRELPSFVKEPTESWSPLGNTPHGNTFSRLHTVDGSCGVILHVHNPLNWHLVLFTMMDSCPHEGRSMTTDYMPPRACWSWCYRAGRRNPPDIWYWLLTKHTAWQFVDWIHEEEVFSGMENNLN